MANKLDIDMIEAERILDMTSNNSSSHSAWLTFMYPRLYLAKQLLSEYGAIFISIDDNEVYNLKQLCDQIFGEENFVSQITWQCLDTIKMMQNISRIMMNIFYAMLKIKKIKN